MSKYAISYAPIGSRIQIGRLNKAGDMFLNDKEYHTNEAIYAVIQHVIHDFNGTMELEVGNKTFKITAEDKL